MGLKFEIMEGEPVGERPRIRSFWAAFGGWDVPKSSLDVPTTVACDADYRAVRKEQIERMGGTLSYSDFYMYPEDCPYIGQFDDDDLYNYETDRLVYRRFKVECPGCGKMTAPLCSQNTIDYAGGWQWVGLDHREPYTSYWTRHRCGQQYRFKLVTPQ